MIVLVAECFGKKVSYPVTEEAQEITAGSLPENPIYLPYKGVSRKHFMVFRSQRSWKVKDLESRNGTYLNGERVPESVIRPGDVITAGIVQITIKSLKEVEQEEETIRLPEGPYGQRRDTGDLEMKSVSKELAKENIFFFPSLVFPEDMVLGSSSVVFEILKKLQAIADTDLNVLLVGETGVGKEMLAKTVHLSSKRAKGPFVAVNCAAIPSDLAESELFGIGEKVATDVQKRTGLVTTADKGTLFLDELSAFPIGLQAKVLRAVEEKSFFPVGEKNAVHADFRIISTSNEDPKELIETGRLREDLYHRLATVEIYIPPLREHKEDLEPLVLGLLQILSAKENKKIVGLRKSALKELMNYDYPGNVRELTNILKAMLAMAHSGEVLTTDLLPEKVLKAGRQVRGHSLDGPTVPHPRGLRTILDGLTKQLIQEALHLYEGNMTRAAEYLEITPRGLRKMMKRLHLDRDGLDQ